MAQKGKNPAAVALGRRGGVNSRKNLPEGEAAALARKAVQARWDAYYAAHPEKLVAKQAKAATKKAGKKAGK